MLVSKPSSVAEAEGEEKDEEKSNSRPPWALVSSGEEVTEEELEKLADEFASQIPEEKFSLAQIQEFLIRHKDDPRNAVKKIGERG